MRTPEADLTSHDLDLIVQRGNYRPVKLTFSDMDFTGCTDLNMRLRPDCSDTVVAMAGTFPTTGSIQVVLSVAAWAALVDVSKAEYQIDYLNPSSQRVIEVGGTLTVEESLL